MPNGLIGALDFPELFMGKLNEGFRKFLGCDLIRMIIGRQAAVFLFDRL